jgi:hypothetical protein
MWFSHKLNHAALRYEIAIGINNGFIVWVNGPFPAGDWPDLNIARSSLIHFLYDNEFYIADGGYRDGQQWSVTPTGRHEFADRQKAVARSRHETINAKMKKWAILRNTYRHDITKHGKVFKAVANIVELRIETDSPTWEIEYDESEF